MKGVRAGDADPRLPGDAEPPRRVVSVLGELSDRATSSTSSGTSLPVAVGG